MAHFLPAPIMTFFRPPPPLPYKPPLEHKQGAPLTGVAAFMERFKDPVPPVHSNPTPQQKREKRKRVKAERVAKRIAIQLQKWDPRKSDKPEMTTDAYKTLFVGRLSKDLSEADIKAEFEYYGPVKKVTCVNDKKTGKFRGYAFVEFESSKDFSEAIHDADGRKINGRRIVVDVERGRTVKNWRPRRLGGGLGGSRIGGKDENKVVSGRDPGALVTTRETRDKDRDRDRRDRDRDRDRGRDRERDRDKDRDRDAKRDRSRERDHRHRSRSRSRSSGRDRRKSDRSASPR